MTYGPQNPGVLEFLFLLKRNLGLKTDYTVKNEK